MMYVHTLGYHIFGHILPVWTLYDDGVVIQNVCENDLLYHVINAIHPLCNVSKYD